VNTITETGENLLSVQLVKKW